MHAVSAQFGRAFTRSVNGPFSTGPFALNLAVRPALPDGFVMAGLNAGETVESLIISPFCDAPAGTLFSMRLFYWNRRGDDLDSAVWVGSPLVEVLCSTSNVAGPASDNPNLAPNERLCDQITLTAGNLGLTGTIYSFGAGSDLPALVNVEIQGALLLSFDFQAVDPNVGNPLDGVNMNAFYAKYS